MSRAGQEQHRRERMNLFVRKSDTALTLIQAIAENAWVAVLLDPRLAQAVAERDMTTLLAAANELITLEELKWIAPKVEIRPQAVHGCIALLGQNVDLLLVLAQEYAAIENELKPSPPLVV